MHKDGEIVAVTVESQKYADWGAAIQSNQLRHAQTFRMLFSKAKHVRGLASLRLVSCLDKFRT